MTRFGTVLLAATAMAVLPSAVFAQLSPEAQRAQAEARQNYRNANGGEDRRGNRFDRAPAQQASEARQQQGQAQQNYRNDRRGNDQLSPEARRAQAEARQNYLSAQRGNDPRYGNDRRGNDSRWNGNGNGNDGRYGNGNWSNNWRQDRRYDWRGYRNSNRSAFRAGRYYAPRGWNSGYRRFSVGLTLPSLFYGQNYWLSDPYQYRLPPAYGTYRWVRYYDDVVLVDIRSGQVVDVIPDFFW